LIALLYADSIDGAAQPYEKKALYRPEEKGYKTSDKVAVSNPGLSRLPFFKTKYQ
jgi:hypothetical protein